MGEYDLLRLGATSHMIFFVVRFNKEQFINNAGMEPGDRNV